MSDLTEELAKAIRDTDFSIDTDLSRLRNLTRDVSVRFLNETTDLGALVRDYNEELAIILAASPASLAELDFDRLTEITQEIERLVERQREAQIDLESVEDLF